GAVARWFVIVPRDRTVEGFVDAARVGPATLAQVGEGVGVSPPEALGPALEALGTARRAVQVEPSSAAAWIAQRLEPAGARIVRGADPCALPKAIKNEVELRGTRAVHERDGAALC